MKYFAALGLIALTSCQTMAPSNYELNRRSGLSVTADTEDNEDARKGELAKIRTGRLPSKNPLMPARVAPVIEKIWVYDQIVNEGEWMQGTWIFIEVEKAKWLPELDSGHGSFIDTGKVRISKKIGNS